MALLWSETFHCGSSCMVTDPLKLKSLNMSLVLLFFFHYWLVLSSIHLLFSSSPFTHSIKVLWKWQMGVQMRLKKGNKWLWPNERSLRFIGWNDSMVGLMYWNSFDVFILSICTNLFCFSSVVCKVVFHIQMVNEDRHVRRRSESKVRQLWLTPLLMHMFYFALKCVFLSLKR